MPRIPSASLFPTDRPLPADELIGRRAEIDELTLSLAAGQNRVVAVARRMGKTSLCEAALERLQDQGLFVVAVDLWGVSDAEELADAVLAHTFRSRDTVYRALRQVFKTGSPYRQALHDVARLAADQTGLPAEITDLLDDALAIRSERKQLRYLESALRMPEQVATREGGRAVLFLDEFQDIVKIGAGLPEGWDELAKRMRTVFQRSGDVSFLFTGSIEHMMRTLFGDARSAFGNFGSFFPLGPIPKEDWRRGIRERLARDSCEIDESALERLIELGEGHPRATMLLAQQTHLLSIARQSHLLTAELVEQGLFEALRSEEDKHREALERVRSLSGKKTAQGALRLIREIARGERPYQGRRDSPAATSRPLNALREAGFIESDDRGWYVIDPLFARYLRALDPLA